MVDQVNSFAFHFRASLAGLQDKVWHPSMVPGDGLESSHCMVLPWLLSQVLFQRIYSRRLPCVCFHCWVIFVFAKLYNVFFIYVICLPLLYNSHLLITLYKIISQVKFYHISPIPSLPSPLLFQLSTPLQQLSSKAFLSRSREIKESSRRQHVD